jgi:peptidoglycan/xylan/chitin deacetylase (PgdA/CDA1 family)
VRGILTYHSIDDSGSVISTPPSLFRQQAAWLASGQIQVVPLDEIQRLPPESDAVALTFDDGFENFAAVAWPELRERQLPATLFVVVDHVGRTNEWVNGARTDVPTLPLLDWAELGRLAEEGVSIGSHTRTHPALTRLDRNQLEDEVAGSLERIRRDTGVRPQAFAYPFGCVDSGVADAVRRVYRWACTTELRFVGPSDAPHLLPRIDMYYCRRRGRLESWESTGFQSYISMRRLLRRLRSQRI